ncbi:MAG: MATE family efflux transporter [Pseudomonadales bacterium]|nr:MATE family efflux transporter [Pseudomonadales bacterium]
MPTLYQRILAITWPLVLSNISIPLLGLADSAMLGHLDSPEFLGAAALGASLITLVFASLNFLRMSTTGLSAQAFGTNDLIQQTLSLKQSLILALLLASVLLLLSPWIIQLGLYVMLINDVSSLYHLSQEYCQIRFYAAPATLLNYVLVGWAIGQQNSRLAMLSLTTTSGINIALDYLFILQWDWQTAGSAWASVIAEYSSLAIVSLYMIKRYPDICSRLFQKIGGHNYKRLFTLNQDLFIRSSCLLFVFAFFNSQGAQLGDTVLAANAILLQLVMLQSYALDGFANATEALVGQEKSKLDTSRTRMLNIFKATALCSFLTALMLIAGFFIAKPWLASIFTSQPALIAIFNQYSYWVIFLPIVSVWAYWLDGVAVGLTASKAMRNSLVIAVFLIFLPIWYFTQHLGNSGLWLSFFVFSTARGLLLLPLLKNNKYDVTNNHQ